MKGESIGVRTQTVQLQSKHLEELPVGVTVEYGELIL